MWLHEPELEQDCETNFRCSLEMLLSIEAYSVLNPINAQSAIS